MKLLQEIRKGWWSKGTIKNKELTMIRHLHLWQGLGKSGYLLHLPPSWNLPCIKWM